MNWAAFFLAMTFPLGIATFICGVAAMEGDGENSSLNWVALGLLISTSLVAAVAAGLR